MSQATLSVHSINFVEARITAISVKEETKSLEIFFKAQDSSVFVLVAHEIDRLLISEFREQNIVDRVHVWDSTSLLRDYRSSLVELLFGSSEIVMSPELGQLVQLAIDEIQSGAKVLFEIEPLYGAAVNLLAKKITVFQQ